MNLQEYISGINNLLKAEIENVSSSEKIALLWKHLELYKENEALWNFRLRFVPFYPGRRPVDEITYPGMGSSEAVGLYTG